MNRLSKMVDNLQSSLDTKIEQYEDALIAPLADGAEKVSSALLKAGGGLGAAAGNAIFRDDADDDDDDDG